MADLTPATPFKLSDTKLTVLASAITNVITDLETQNQPLFTAMEVWHKTYEAQPKSKQKNWPFMNASNVVVPLAKTMVDSRVASIWTSIHGSGDQIWTAKTENQAWEDSAKQMVRYLNWQARNDFDFATVSYDWLMEATQMGSSVIAGSWRNDKRHTYVKSGGKVKAVELSWNRGPNLEHVPRRQMLWDTSARSIGEAPVVVRQFAKTWPEIAALATGSSGWIMKNVEFIQHHPGMIGPAEAIAQTEAELDHRDTTPIKAFEPHDLREVHISWPNLNQLDINGNDLMLPGNMKIKTAMVDIVVTIHRKTQRIVRLTTQPYFFAGKPFFDTYFHKRPGRGFSVGMTKIVEGLQAAITTVFNQGIDSQTRANSIWAKTSNRDLIDQPIDMSRPVYDATMKSFEALDLKGNDFGNIQLIQLIQATAERLSGQSDPAQGRETRLGGHSAPATTTLALLERGNALAAPDRKLLQTSLGRVAEFVLSVNQQFETNDNNKIERVLGEIDGEAVGDVLFPDEPIQTNFMFNVKGLDKGDNPEAELQKQIGIRNENTIYNDIIIKAHVATSEVSKVVDPMMRKLLMAGYKQTIISQTRTFKRILDAADIDDTEDFLLDVLDADSPHRKLLDALSDQLEQGGGVQSPPVQPGSVGGLGGAVVDGPPGLP